MRRSQAIITKTTRIIIIFILNFTHVNEVD